MAPDIIRQKGKWRGKEHHPPTPGRPIAGPKDQRWRQRVASWPISASQLIGFLFATAFWRAGSTWSQGCAAEQRAGPTEPGADDWGTRAGRPAVPLGSWGHREQRRRDGARLLQGPGKQRGGFKTCQLWGLAKACHKRPPREGTARTGDASLNTSCCFYPWATLTGSTSPGYQTGGIPSLSWRCHAYQTKDLLHAKHVLCH